jgi:hypothetical protein
MEGAGGMAKTVSYGLRGLVGQGYLRHKVYNRSSRLQYMLRRSEEHFGFAGSGNAVEVVEAVLPALGFRLRGAGKNLQGLPLFPGKLRRGRGDPFGIAGK